MEKTNLILQDRETKNRYIQKLISNYQIISLKANIPGINKNINDSIILLEIFDQLLNTLGYKKNNILSGDDGTMYIYLVDKNLNIKEDMVKIEETHPLGRFIDIDVFNESISYNRKNLRKCYLCDNPAFVCARNQNHNLVELTDFIHKKVENYLIETVKLMCNEAIMEELNLHPKFGLVTPYTNGSHNDMNYELMIKAKNAIVDNFLEMFIVGFQNDNINNIFKIIRDIGKNAEKKMFNETSGINAYKGLIFDLGLIVASIGYKLSHFNDDINIFNVVKEMTKGLTKELEHGNDTFGKTAFQKYKISGARGEAENGFIHVQHLLKDNLDNTRSLIYLISNIDDTVLLKRCKTYQKYLNIKDMFKLVDNSNESIEKLNKYCIENNLSFGGAADLLIVYLFIKKMNNVINLNIS